MQIVDIAIPLPSKIVPWKTDEQGRKTADIPGVGLLVELSKEDADAARELAKENLTPDPLAFDLKFSDGVAGLYVRACDLDSKSSSAISGT